MICNVLMRTLNPTHSHSPTHPLTHPPTHPPTHPSTHPSTHPPTHSLTHSHCEVKSREGELLISSALPSFSAETQWKQSHCVYSAISYKLCTQFKHIRLLCAYKQQFLYGINPICLANNICWCFVCLGVLRNEQPCIQYWSRYAFLLPWNMSSLVCWI